MSRRVPAGILVARALRLGGVTLLVMGPALAGCALRVAVGARGAGRLRLHAGLAVLLMRLGPTFVKAGQVLGTRRDLLPASLCERLSVLQDSVSPLSETESRRAFARVYGPALAEVFAELDHRPIASGSVACVYRGRLRSGRDAAVKLRRPGIATGMLLDLALIRRGAAVAARLPVFRGVPVTDVVEAVCEAVFRQLDFEREAAALHRLGENLADVPRVWVPRVYSEASRPECIVMEYIPDLDLESARRCSAAVRRRFAVSGLTAVYQMLFVDGFVHCDLHPGNLYFTRAGDTVVLDAGFSVQLSERLRRLFAEFFLNFSTGRGRECARIVIESAAGTRDDADLAGFTARMADLVERSHGLAAKEFSLMAFAAEMFDLQRGFGIHAAPELIFPLLSLLVIEGTIRELDPDIDFQETARPVLSRGLFGAAKPGRAWAL